MRIGNVPKQSVHIATKYNTLVITSQTYNNFYANNVLDAGYGQIRRGQVRMQ